MYIKLPYLKNNKKWYMVHLFRSFMCTKNPQRSVLNDHWQIGNYRWFECELGPGLNLKPPKTHNSVSVLIELSSVENWNSWFLGFTVYGNLTCAKIVMPETDGVSILFKWFCQFEYWHQLRASLCIQWGSPPCRVL